MILPSCFINQSFYFDMFLFEFGLKVTLCNNLVWCGPLSDAVGFCRTPRLFLLLEVCVVIIKPTGPVNCSVWSRHCWLLLSL